MPFSLIDGIRRVSSFEELPEAIRAFRETETLDNIHSAAAYLEAVKEAGTEVKIFELMDGAEEIFAGRSAETEEFDAMLQELLLFYEKAYLRYQEDGIDRD